MSLPVSDLLSEYGSPLYVYDLDLVRERARTLREAIAYEPTRLLYAIKANPCPGVACVLVEEGYGVDAVSSGEVALALRLGLSPQDILYTENNMTDAEMQEALREGVLINCGSCDRLRRLGQAGGRRAAVRFNPDIGGGLHAHVCTAGPLTKFGVHHSRVDEVLAIERDTGVRVVGCHMHIGSGILDAELYARAMRVILDVAVRLPHLQFIDFGGGLGIPYHDEDRPMDLRRLGRAATGLMEEFTAEEGRRLELRLEPGRFLVGEAGTLYTTVTSVKTNPDGRCYVGCDTGFNHLLRPILYDSHHRIDNVSNPDAPPVLVDVVGNICETGDVFARERAIPQPSRGDVLAIRDTGAYGMSMASTYNLRPLPAEVGLSHGAVRLLRPRQSIDDLLQQWSW
ncbi:MAG: diaminopimelate decarboxylase [Planctomycetota bacterium]